MQPHETGKQGEADAEGYLHQKGLVVLERRYRCRGGEIDLVCMRGSSDPLQIDEIVFVEVKARKSNAYGPPEAAIGRMKRRRLVLAASHYLQEHVAEPVAVRFDVVSIRYINGRAQIEHFEHALGPIELGSLG